MTILKDITISINETFLDIAAALLVYKYGLQGLLTTENIDYYIATVLIICCITTLIAKRITKTEEQDQLKEVK